MRNPYDRYAEEDFNRIRRGPEPSGPDRSAAPDSDRYDSDGGLDELVDEAPQRLPLPTRLFTPAT